VAAEVDGEPVDVFSVRTEGVTDGVTLHAAPTHPADAGEMRATAVCVDHRGTPVTGAALHVELTMLPDDALTGRCIERGDGVYELLVETRQAGEWRLSAKDRQTGAIARACLHVLPGAPERIVFDGDPDPRLEPPYDEARVRAVMEDRHGNALDPTGMQGWLDGQPIPVVPVGHLAVATAKFVGYGQPVLKLRHEPSGVELEGPLLFPAVWFEAPKVVEPGADYRLKVFALPPPDRPATHATIEITFDTGRTKYKSLSPVEEGPALGLESRVEGDQLIVEVTPERELGAPEFPEGIPVCHVEWSCTGEGPTWFSAIGKMSPSRPGTGICVQQKSEIKNRVCVCTNVIYRRWRPTERLTGRDMVRQLLHSMSRSLYSCCPYMWSVIHECELTGADWLRLRTLWRGAVLPQDRDDIDLMFDSGICQRANCMNVYVVETQQAGVHGRAAEEGPPGIVAIDPRSFTSQRSLAAHEFGHSLGLAHRHEAGNVMVPGIGGNTWRGETFNSDQCETIWRTALRSYPC